MLSEKFNLEPEDNDIDLFSRLLPHELEKLGIEQWKQLDELNNTFALKPMSQFYNGTKFKDRVWWLAKDKKIDWGNIENKYPNSLPFIILVKVAVYFTIQITKINSSLFYGNITRVIESIGSRMASEGILSGSKNAPFKPGSEVSTQKLHTWIVSAVDNFEFRGPTVLNCLERIINIPISQFDDIKFLNISCETPWERYKNRTAKALSDIRYFYTQQYINDILGEKATRTSIKSFQPFSENACAKLLDFATPIVNEYQDLLKEIFDLTSYRQNLTSNGCLNARTSSVILSHKESLDKILPVTVFKRKNRKPVVRAAYMNQLYEIVQGAALWIIFLTSALRNIDVRKNLLKNCHEPDPDSELMNYLVTDIEKTKQEDYPIPIPPVTVNTIKLLLNLNYAPDSCPYLIVRRNFDASPNTKKWNYEGGAINRLLRLVANHVGADLFENLQEDDNDEGMAHRCRATMAGWIGTNSPIAVMIVRRLFGHTNGIMPDHYLKANNKVREVRRELTQKTQTDLSDSIAVAIVDNKVGGGMKRVLKNGRDELEKLIKEEAIQKNESLTEGEIRLRLIDRVSYILKQKLLYGDVLGLQTPLSLICMRPTSSNTDAPCAVQSNKLSRINKEIDEAFAKGIQLSNLPVLENCKGPLCGHSLLFDNPIAKILLEQFKYYATYLQGIRHTVIDLDKEAETFIKLYFEPLKDVYPEAIEQIKGEASEGIFDA